MAARAPVTTGKSVIFIYLHIALNEPIDTIGQKFYLNYTPFGSGFIMIPEKLLFESVQKNVVAALEEDLGSGDVTASLIQESTDTSAKVISREKPCFVESFGLLKQ